MSKYESLIKNYCIAVDRENEQTIKNNKLIDEYNVIKKEVDRLLEIECNTKLLHNARRKKLLILSDELDLAFIPAIKIVQERNWWHNPKPKPTRVVIGEIKEQLTLDELNCEEHVSVSELIFLSDNNIVDYKLYEKIIDNETSRRASAAEFRNMACYYGRDSDKILRKKYQIFDNPPPLIAELNISSDSKYMDKKPKIPSYMLIMQ